MSAGSAGAIVTVVGFGVAWFPLNALHRLTNRFLVFVPNGLVVHDPTQLREPVLFVKREIAGLAPAPADTTAKDITAAALASPSNFDSRQRPICRSSRAHDDRQRDRALPAHRPDSPHRRYGHGARAR